MHRVIRELKRLSDPKKGDRGALSTLRRGLTVPPGEYVPMFAYLRDWLTDEECAQDFDTYCLVASLYALHPVDDPEGGNLGSHMRGTMGETSGSKPLAHATERRFLALLRVHPADLPRQLPRTVAFLESKKQGVNWQQLLDDLLLWKRNPDIVRKRWALEFWRHLTPEPSGTPDEPQEEPETEPDFDEEE